MPRRQASGVAGVVAGGDHRASLEALRDRLAAELDRPADDGVPVASVSKQLVEVLEKLKALPGKKESPVDELAKRRAARRAGTTVSKRAAAPVKRGTGGGRARS